MPRSLTIGPAIGLAIGLALLAALLMLPVAAKEALPASADPALEARVQAVAAELRCLVCQNQTIADSNSDLANDLRREVREQLKRGVSDEQVVQYMTDRYGDFVRYRPPLKSSTALLWFGPALLLAAGLGALVMVLRRRSKLAPEAFEADEDDVLDLPERSLRPGPGDSAR
ncbi:MAG: cytochrome c-type biogenesis protein [Burkholderiaceae bacterium]